MRRQRLGRTSKRILNFIIMLSLFTVEKIDDMIITVDQKISDRLHRENDFS